MIRFVWLAPILALGLGCGTASTAMREKSAASAALYAATDTALQTLGKAVTSELRRRDRVAHMQAIYGGTSPAFASTFKAPGTFDPVSGWVTVPGMIPNPETDGFAKAAEAVKIPLAMSRISYGVVDRFMRIEVLDLDDLKAVTGKAAEAFGEPAEGN